MALFTDGPIATTDDLVGYDSAVLSVASTEGIDVTKKLSLAMDELALELSIFLPNSDGLSNVAVTPAITMWHTYRALELVYRDAYQNQLNDRYAGKRDQFAALVKRAFENLMAAGIGIIANPIAKAGPAELTYLPGEQPGATYYACMSWTSEQGEEGAAGELRAVSVPGDNVLSVRGVIPPPNAKGWNVFVGLSPDTLVQQNLSPLSPGQPWIQQDAVSTDGRAPSNGQTASYLRKVTHILNRG
jgi:hypothetical protein